MSVAAVSSTTTSPMIAPRSLQASLASGQIVCDPAIGTSGMKFLGLARADEALARRGAALDVRRSLALREADEHWAEDDPALAAS